MFLAKVSIASFDGMFQSQIALQSSGLQDRVVDLVFGAKTALISAFSLTRIVI